MTVPIFRSRRSMLAAGAALGVLAWGAPVAAAPVFTKVELGSVATPTVSGSTTTVTQSSQRAVVDWSKFNIAKGETVDFVQNVGGHSAITFNRVDPLSFSTISGSITAQGGVWIFSPAGILIGSGAHIDVGSFVASTGDIGANCINCMAGGAISITGAVNPITIQTGAEVTADAGFVALNGASIAQDGQVTASDGVAYILGDNANISFGDGAPSGPSGPIGPQTLLGVDLSNANAGNASMVQGVGASTKGAFVGVFGPNTSGFSGVINLSGAVEATGVAPSGAGGAVVLVGATTPAYSSNAFAIDTSGAQITGDAGGLMINGASAKLGNATLDQFVAVSTSGDITIGPSVTIRSDSGGNGYNYVELKAGSSNGSIGSISADPTSFIVTGKPNGPATSAVILESYGGDLKAGAVSGTNVHLRALHYGSGPSGAVGGALVVGGAVQGTSYVEAFSELGSVTVDANISTAGAIRISAGPLQPVVIGPGVTIDSDNLATGPAPSGGSGVIIIAGSSITADPTSSIFAGASAKTPTDSVRIYAENSLGAGDLSVGAVSGTDVTLDAPNGNVTLNGNVLGANSIRIDPANLYINANVTTGGYLGLYAHAAIDIAKNVTVRSDLNGTGGDMRVFAKTVGADPTSLLVAGPLVGPPTSAVRVYTYNGALSVGRVQGTVVVLGASGSAGPSGGSLFIGGQVLGTTSVSARSYHADLTVQAPVGGNAGVSSGGPVSLWAYHDITIGPAVTINSDTVGKGATGAGVSITAYSGKLDADSTSLILAGPTAKAPTNSVYVYASGNLTLGGVSGTDVTLRAPYANVTLNGDVLGATSLKIDPTNLYINANVTTAGSLDLTAVDAIDISSGVTVRADSAGGGAGVLTVEGKTVDAQPTSLLVAGPGGAPPTSGVNVYADGGDLAVGAVQGTDVQLIARGPTTPSSYAETASATVPSGGSLTIGGAVLGTKSVFARSYYQGVSVQANVASGGPVSITAGGGDIIIGPAVTIDADSQATGPGGPTGAGVYLNASGSISADKSSIILAGASANAPADVVGIYAGPSGNLTLGAVAGTDVTFSAPTGNVTLNGAVFGANSLTIDPNNVYINANVTTGGGLNVLATDAIDIAKAVTVRSDSTGAGGGDMTLEARTIDADATSLLVAGPAKGSPTSAVRAYADGGALSVGAVQGTTVRLEARGASGPSAPTGGGSLTIGGAVTGIDGVTAISDFANVDVEASVASGGPVTVTAATTIAVAPHVTINSDNGSAGPSGPTGPLGVTLTATSGAITADVTSLILAGKSAATPGDFVKISAGGNLTLGQVDGTDVTLTTPGDATLNGAVFGSKSVTIDPANIFINANLTSGGTLDLTATNAIDIAKAVTVRSDSTGAGGGDMTLEARTIDADATSLLVAGPAKGSPTSAVRAYADGGALSVGAVQGTTVRLEARGASGPSAPTGGGGLTIGGAVLGASSVFAISDYAGVKVAANVASGGPVTIGARGGDIAIGPAVTINSDNKATGPGGPTGAGVDLYASGSITADIASAIFAGAKSNAPADVVGIYAGASGNLILGPVSGTAVTLRASNGDITLDGPVLGSTSVSVDPNNLYVNANLTSGGTLDLTATNAIDIAKAVTVRSDSTGAGGGDMTLEARTIDADATSLLVAGPAKGSPTSAVRAYADGGALSVGAVQGTTVRLEARGASGPSAPTGGGGLTIGGAVLGASSVFAISDYAGVKVAANVASGGPVTIGARGGDIAIGPAVTINSDNKATGPGGPTGAGVDLYASGSITADIASAIFAGAKSNAPADVVGIYAGASGNLILGPVSGTAVTLRASNGDITLDGPVLGSTSVSVDPNNLYVNANLTSGGTLDLTATNAIDIAKAVTVRSDSTGAGGGDMTLEARTIDADATSLLVAGPAKGSPTSAVRAYADGGALSVGAVQGTTVRLEARGASGPSAPTGGGGLTIGGAVLGASSVFAISDYAGVKVAANVASGGPVTIGARGGDIAIGPAVTINSDNKATGPGGPTGAGVDLYANGSITADIASAIFAGAKSNAPADVVGIYAGASGNLILGPVSGTAVTLRASNGDITLDGPVLGSTSVSVDPNNLYVNANLTSGGTLDLTATDAIDIAKAVTVRSDSTGAGGGDMTLDATTISADPTSLIVAGPVSGAPTSKVSLYADGGDLSVGPVQGTSVLIDRRAPKVAPSGLLVGNVTIGGAIAGTTGVTILDNFGAAGGTPPPGTFTGGENIFANVTSGGAVTLSTFSQVNLAPGVTVRSDSGGLGKGALTIEASGVGDPGDGTSLLVAGPVGGPPTSAVSVFADGHGAGAGDNLILGGVSGRDVVLSSAGNATLNGVVLATKSVDVGTATAVYGSQSRTITPANLTVNASVTSGGTATLQAVNSIDIAPLIVVQADSNGTGAGGVTLTATSGAITADVTSLILAGKSAATPGDFVKISAGGNLTLGQVDGTDVTLTTPGDATLNGAVFGSKSVTIDPANVFINANLTSGGTLDLTATDAIDIAKAVTVRSDSTGAGGGDMTLDATTISADATSLIVAGPVSGAPTSKVSVYADGGDLSVGPVQGTSVLIDRRAPKVAPSGPLAGNVTLSGPVVGTTSVTVLDDFGADEPPGSTVSAGNDFIDANVTSGGAIDVKAFADVNIAAGVTVRSDSAGAGGGNLTVEGAGVNADPTALLVAGPVSGAPSSAVSVYADGFGIDVGPVRGTDVRLEARGPAPSGPGVGGAGARNVRVAEPLLGGKSVTVLSDFGDVTMAAGATSGGAVIIGAAGVIDISPLIVVQADSNGTGAGGVTLTATSGAITADVTSLILAGTAASAPSDFVKISAGGNLTLGQVDGTDVTLTTPGDATLNGAVFGSKSVTIDPANIFINANLTSGGTLDLTATDAIDIAKAVTVRSDSTGAGGGDMTLEARTIDADATSLLVAGPAKGSPTSAVRAYADGGALSVGAVQGTTVRLEARGASGPSAPTGGGGLTIGGAVTGIDGVTAISDFANVDVEASVASGGPVTVTAATTIAVAPHVTINSDNGSAGPSGPTGPLGVTLTATSGAITADVTSLILAGKSAATPGDFVKISAGGNLTLGQVDGTDVTLTTPGDATLNGAVFGSKSVTIDPANIFINANLTSGGTLDLTATAAIDIAKAVTVRSDSTGAGGGDMTLDATTISADPTSLIVAGPVSGAPTSKVSLYADGGDLSVGPVQGTSVLIDRRAPKVAPSGPLAGNVTLEGAVLGTNGVTVLDEIGDAGPGSNAPTGGITADANIASGGAVDLTAWGELTLAPGITVRSDSGGAGGGGLHVEGAGVNADPTSVLVAGPASGAPTSAVGVYSDGFFLTAGAVQGTDIVLQARGQIPGGCCAGAAGGPVQVTRPIVGTKSVTVQSDLGDVDFLAGATSGGAVTISAAGVIDIAPLIVIQADSNGTGAGGASLHASGAITADVTSLILAGTAASAPSDFVKISAGGNLTLGQVDGTDVTLTTPDDATLNGAVFGSKSVTIDPANIFINANLTSGGTLDLTAADAIDIAKAVTVQSDLAGKGGGDMMIEAASVNADPTSLIVAGPLVGPPTSRVTVYADGGNLTAGGVRGTTVLLDARGPTGGSGPSGAAGGILLIGGSVLGTQAVTALSELKSVDVEANLASAGPVSVTAATTITVGPHVTINADSADAGDPTGTAGVTLTATSGAITADVTSLILAGKSAATPGDFVKISAGGNLTLGQVDGTDVTLTTPGDATLNGAVFGSKSVTIDPANIFINANLTSGGTLDLTATDAIDIAKAVTVRSDSTGAGGGDMTLDATTISADATSLIVAGPVSGAPTSKVSVYADGGDLSVGPVQGTSVLIDRRAPKVAPSGPLAGNVTLSGPVVGTTSVTVLDDFGADEPPGSTVSAGNDFIDANVTSGGAIDVKAFADVNIAAGVTVRSDSAGAGGGNLTVEGAGVNADPTALLVAGPVSGAPSSAVSVYADGFGIDVGPVRGTDVRLEARGPAPSGPGVGGAGARNVRVAEALLGGKSVTVLSDFGDVYMAAGATSRGAVTIGAAGIIDIAPLIVVQADSNGTGAGGASLHASGAITADATSLILAGTTASAPSDFVKIAAGGNLTLGQVDGTDVTLTTPDDATLNGAVFGSKSVTIDPANIFINANLTSGGTLDLTATDAIDIAKAVTVRSDSTGAGGGDMTLDATTISADATSLIVAGPVSGAPTSKVSVYADGGDLSVGPVQGTSVLIDRRAPKVAPSGPLAGNVTLSGPVVGTTSVTVLDDFGADEPPGSTVSAGNDFIDANVTSGGAIDVKAFADVNIAAGVTVRSDSAGAGGGNLTVEGAGVNADPTALLVAGPVSGAPSSAVSVYADGFGIDVGPVRGTDVRLEARGPAPSGPGVGGAGARNVRVAEPLLGGKSVTVLSDFGDVTMAAGATSGGAVTISAAGIIDISPLIVVQADSNGTGAGGASLHASGAITADVTSLILAGTTASAPSDFVKISAGGNLTLGQVDGTDVTLTTPGDATLNGAVFGSKSVTIDPNNIFINANLTSGGTLDLTATDAIDIAKAVTVRSDSAGGGSGDMTLEATTISADATSLIVAGPVSGAPTSKVSLYADGGDLSVGPVQGTNVLIDRRAPKVAPSSLLVGDVTIGGAVLGTTGVTILDNFGAAGGTPPPGTFTGGENIFANVTSGGAVTLSTFSQVNLAPGVTVRSDSGGLGKGALSIEASGVGDANDAASLLVAGPVKGPPTSAVTVFADGHGAGAGDNLILGGVSGTDVVLSSAGNVTLNGAILGAKSVDIGTATAVYGSQSRTITPANLTVNASVTSGGTATLQAVNSIDIAPLIVVQADSNGTGAGGASLHASGAITADVTSLILAGTTASAPSDFVKISAGGNLTLGQVDGTDVTLTTPGDATLNGAVFGSKSVTIDPANIFINANLTSGGTLDLTATDAIDIAKAVTVRSDSTGAGGGDMTLDATTISADATSLIVAGPVSGAPTSRVTVFADGGNLTAGGVRGTTVLLDARGPTGGSGPSGAAGGVLVIGGSVLGTQAVTALSEVKSVDVEANLASGGPVSVTAATTITVAPHVTINADSADADPTGTAGVTLTATSGAITADVTSLILAGTTASAPSDFVKVSAGGNLTLGQVDGTDVTLTTPDDATLNGAVFGSKSVTIDPANIFINANLTSGGTLDLTATDAVVLGAGASLTAVDQIDASAGAITLAPGSVVRSDSAGKGAGGVDLRAGGNFAADKTSLVMAGADPSSPTDAVTIAAGTNTTGAGGSLTAGPIAGTLVSLATTGGAGAGAGDLIVDGAVLGTAGVVAYSNPGDGGTRSGFTELAASVTSGGTIDIRAEGAGALAIDPGISVVSSGGEVYLASNHDLTIAGGAKVSGVSFAGEAQGALTLAAGATIATTGSTPAPTWPIAPATIVASTTEGVRTPTVTSLNLGAKSLDIQGQVTAGQSGAREDIYIEALGSPSLVTIGGSPGVSGFQLSNADLANLSGRNIVVMGGDGEGGAQNADVQLADLTLDSTKVSGLWVGTSSGHVVDVIGQTSVVGGGPLDVRLGFARSSAGGSESGPTGPLGGFIPGRIEISGALGAPSAPLDAVSLLARNDIFMGTTGFIGAAAADQNFDAVKSSKAYPGLPQGYVFIAAKSLQLGAQGRIIQQNTSTLTVPDSAAYGGLTIDAPTPSNPLIATPPGLDGQTIGQGGWVAAYQRGPTRIDVFGILRQPNGTTTSGVDAALQANLLDSPIPASRSYRINSCVFGDHCVTIPPPTFQPPPPDINQIADSTSTTPVLSFESDITLPDTDDDDHKKNSVPITESGNGDLWAEPGPAHK